MPKIEIVIDEQGNAQQTYSEFTAENPACLCREKIRNALGEYGLAVTEEKVQERTKGHQHTHVHDHG